MSAEVTTAARYAWQLEPGVVHLNHGSFGAAPTAVLVEQQRWRDLMERNPVRFMVEHYQPALEEARAALAAFIGADPAGLVFVNNATAGVNSVLRSLEGRLGPGDEIVVTDHAYNACSNAVVVTAARTGAVVRTVHVPVPLDDGDTVVAAVMDTVTPNTRLAVLDHVTSPTAVLFPIERLVAALEPDVAVLVDGAHAPGMVELDLEALGASYAVGNCHKWMCAPKGAGYLYVREDRRDGVANAVISHGHNDEWPGSGSRFHAQFDWVGTDDPTAWLSVPAAIEHIASLHPGGWLGVRGANHDLALVGRDIVLGALGAEPLVPAVMIGSMTAIPLPPGEDASELSLRLWSGHRIEVPVFAWPGSTSRMLRMSAQLYNAEADYERLATALVAELVGG